MESQPPSELLVYDEIGFFGLTAAKFVEGLKAQPDGDLTVRINSPGGEIAHGLAMYNLLLEERRKGRRVTTVVDGLAASMASIIAMAGDTIKMADSSILMIHNPMGGALGYADDLRKEADVLDLLKTTCMKAYARSGKHAPTIARLMDEETWMDAAEAVKEGFADKVVKGTAAKARWNLGTRYLRAPADVVARFGPHPARVDATPAPITLLIPITPAPPTGHASQEPVMTTENTAAKPPVPDTEIIGKAELAELRALRVAAVAATGCESGLVGAIEALKVNADRAIVADAKLAVRTVVDKMVAAGQIAPRQRAHYEGKPLADVEAAHRVLVADPPPQTPALGGAVDEKGAKERITAEAAAPAVRSAIASATGWPSAEGGVK